MADMLCSLVLRSLLEDSEHTCCEGGEGRGGDGGGEMRGGSQMGEGVEG